MVGNIVVSGNFARRYMPGVLTWYGVYRDYPTEYTNMYTTIKSNKKFEDVVTMVGMSLATLKPEGDTVQNDAFGQARGTRFVPLMYAKSWMITHEAIVDDLYNPGISKIGAQFAAKGIKQSKETLGANLFNNCTVASAAVYNSIMNDGLSLLSTAHVNANGTTYQNKLTVDADLSEASLEQACIDIAGLVDESGLKMQALPNKLIVHRNDMFNIQRILGASNQPDTASNNPNIIGKGNYFPGGWSVNHYFTQPSAWLIKTDQDENGLIFVSREDLMSRAQDDFKTFSTQFSIAERYVAYAADLRSVYGSVGS